MENNQVKLFIWGTGHWADIVLESLCVGESLVIGAIDSSEQKKNTIWKRNIRIGSPDELIEKEYDYVLLAMLDYKDALLKCYDLGIPSQKVVIFTDYSKKYNFIDYYVLTQLLKCEFHKKIEQIKNNNEAKRIEIERQWYEAERKYFLEERNTYKEYIEKIKEEQKRIEIERQWYEAEKKCFLEERNTYKEYIEKIKEEQDRIEIERRWYEEEKEKFANTSNKKDALIADLENRIQHEMYKLSLIEEMAPFEYAEQPLQILSADILLKRLIEERLSLVRFGDGEFEIILKNDRAWFQKGSEQLAKRLSEVLHAKQEGVLIAIADIFGDLRKYTEDAAFGIRDYLKNGKRKQLIDLLDSNTVYYDAYVSRPYMMYRDKKYAKLIFELFTQLWRDRNVLLVEGELMHTGCGNDLFKTARTVRRILCPPRDSFEYYDEILDAIIRNYKKDDLVLIGLGPTATVLAYDVCLKGIQAIDLGQVDNEYEWFKMGVEQRTLIKGKAVPELSKETSINTFFDEEYEKQIVEKIGL